ncbi:MAG: sulfatase-like hydrolase/transferase [Bacteroidales bacterium]|nr:sulfatase-like hydrolase/transferase [Bacteroidales bacterium]
MKINSKILVFSVIPSVLFVGSCAQKEKGKPNIIFLMDDQHRWDALGIVNPDVHTPALDKLAENGVFFNQAVCQAPMCVASRNSMMTGLYPSQTGILRNEPGLPDDALPNRPLAQVLQDAGYQTAGFGKTHWGLECSTRGFEVRYIGECREKGAVMMIDVDPEKKSRYDEEIGKYGPGEENNLGYIGETSALPEGDHRDGWVFEQCQKFIRQREDDRPLFLYLSFLKPHAGHNVPAGYEELYDPQKIKYAEQPPWDEDKSPHAKGINRRELYEGFWKNATDEQWRMMTMRYMANCSWMDHMYERTLAALEEKGLLENALIIYVSDHGEMLGERYYRFNKYCLYESSVRVPVILSGTALPKKYKGKWDPRPAELVDVYPTLMRAAGLQVPEELPGKDLLSSNKRNASFCGLHERENEAAFMWRTSDYKLILMFSRKPEPSGYSLEDIIGGEFYDLKNDPREWNDLFDKAEVKNLQSTMTDELLDHLSTLEKLPPNAVQ